MHRGIHLSPPDDHLLVNLSPAPGPLSLILVWCLFRVTDSSGGTGVSEDCCVKPVCLLRMGSGSVGVESDVE